jgi:hypothetical protein
MGASKIETLDQRNSEASAFLHEALGKRAFDN